MFHVSNPFTKGQTGTDVYLIESKQLSSHLAAISERYAHPVVDLGVMVSPSIVKSQRVSMEYKKTVRT